MFPQKFDAIIQIIMVQYWPAIFFLVWCVLIRLLYLLFSKFYQNSRAKKVLGWVHAMTYEVLAFLGVMLLRLIPTKKKIKGEGTPILLIHGYINHSGVWYFQKKWLKGLGPIYTIDLGHPFLSIREYAEKVQTKAESIFLETGKRKLILIGHSMGGLVALWYALKLAEEGTVTDVITIASPLKGTPLANIAFGKNGKEMRRNSRLVRSLEEMVKKNKKIRLFHIGTKNDQLVFPGISSCILDHQHFIFEGVGHASLLYLKRTAQEIRKWLRRELQNSL